jgi:nicotinamidase-related amidase
MKHQNNTAVLIIDMINDSFRDGQMKDKRVKLTSNINDLVRAARLYQIPIIWVRQEFSPDLSDAFLAMRKKNIHFTIAGTEGCEFLPELERNAVDHEIVKKRYSAFFGTSLDMLIDELRVTRLIICGIYTHSCVRMTAIDAYQRDLDVIIPCECVDSPDAKHHDISLRYLGRGICKVMSLEEVMKKLV